MGHVGSAKMKWEYGYITRDDPLVTGELNRFGEQGWELVSFSVRTYNLHDYATFYYIFKRPLSDEQAAVDANLSVGDGGREVDADDAG
jgi:hypothetical protein